MTSKGQRRPGSAMAAGSAKLDVGHGLGGAVSRGPQQFPTKRCGNGAGHRASRLAPLRRRRHTQMTDFHTPLTCINLASPAAVASGGVQPIPIKTEGSATSEPDSRS